MAREYKTQVHAEPGKQELVITRDFELPVGLLFRAYTEAEIVEQWMGTKVLKLESHRHGSFQFETSDPRGGKHHFHGVIHTFSPEQRIVRTFEFEQMGFGVQLEFLEFVALSEDRSHLRMRVIYESAAQREEVLKLPFAMGINMAHNRLQDVFSAAK